MPDRIEKGWTFSERRDHIKWLRQQAELTPEDRYCRRTDIEQALATHEQTYQRCAKDNPAEHFTSVLPELRELTYNSLDIGFLYDSYRWFFAEDEERRQHYEHLLLPENHGWLLNTVKQKAYNLKKDKGRADQRWCDRVAPFDFTPPPTTDGSGGEESMAEGLDRAVLDQLSSKGEELLYETNPETLLIADETAAQREIVARFALSQMTPRQRRAYTLLSQGYVVKEIALLMDISESGVYQNLRRGAEAVQQALEDVLANAIDVEPDVRDAIGDFAGMMSVD